MKKIYTLILAAGVALSLPACHSGHDHAHEGHDHEAEEAHGHDGHDHDGDERDAHGDDEIVFTPEQAKSAGLKTEKVTSAPFDYSIKCSGEILGAGSDGKTLVAPTSGVVSYAVQGLTAGHAVSGGQALVSISGKGLQGGESRKAMQIRYDAAKREYERAKTLLADKIITQSEFTSIEAEYRIAEAELNSPQARSAAGSASVAAPFGGYVTEINVRPGEYVEEGTPLLTVSRGKRMQLRADVPRRYSSAVASVKSANFSIPGAGQESFSTATLAGRKTVSGMGSTSSTGYIPVVFEFDNPGGLLPGTYVDTWLIGASGSAETITVPMTALSEEQGLYFVFVKVDDHGYRKQQVQTGNSDGQRIEVTTGLKEGDEVVTAAVTHLKLAANTGQIPEGHTHNH